MPNAHDAHEINPRSDRERTLDEILRPGGSISRIIPNYAYRDPQLKAARWIYDTLAFPTVSLAEVDTGVGKTLGYLLPLLLRFRENKNRAVISTFTKALQKQLIGKDLPIALKAMGLEGQCTAGLVMGTSNYVCVKRLLFVLGAEKYLVPDTHTADELQRAWEWSKKTETGLLDEIEPPLPPAIRSQIQRDVAFCGNDVCPGMSMCFSQRAHQKNKNANLLIVNHALFCRDIFSDSKIIPKWTSAVVDEAGSLEHVFANQFGARISPERIFQVLFEVSNPEKERGLLHVLKLGRVRGFKEEQKEVVQTAAQTHRRAQEFFVSLLGQSQNLELTKPIASQLADQLQDLSSRIDDYIRKCEPVDVLESSFRSIQRRLQSLTDDIQACFENTTDDFVIAVEQSFRRKDRFPTVTMTPVEPKGLFRQMEKACKEKQKAICLLGGALSIRKEGSPSFSYVENKLGIKPEHTLRIESPFDYETRTKLFIDERAPDPRDSADAYWKNVSDRLTEIIRATKGRTLALFTSYESLSRVYKDLRSRGLEYPILTQGGEIDSGALVESVRENPGRVILGTTTFWVGVDLQGALRCVVIAKLPFGRPDDIVTAARLKRIEAAGLNPFMDFTVPECVLMVRQGYGRLIRSEEDWGGIAILDPRLASGKRTYSQIIQQSLKPSAREPNFKKFLEFLAGSGPNESGD